MMNMKAFYKLLGGGVLFLKFLCAVKGEVVFGEELAHIPGKGQLNGESNREIREAKEQTREIGSQVKIYIRNKGGAPISLSDISWDDKNLSEHSKSKLLIWHRMRPSILAPGQMGEICLMLRKCLGKKTTFRIETDKGDNFQKEIEPDKRQIRLELVCFERDYRKAYVYFKAMAANVEEPKNIFFNGTKSKVTWFSDRFSNDFKAGVIHFDKPMEKGELCFISTTGKEEDNVLCMTGIRAFSNLSSFAIAGAGQRGEYYRRNGLTGIKFFWKVKKQIMDDLAKIGMRSFMIVGDQPNPELYGHPALHSYLLADEPDAADYGVKDVPVGKRLGANAPKMEAFNKTCQDKDAKTSTMLTVDMTYTPANYFVYAPIPDIVNSDVYPITTGFSVKLVPNYLENVRRASSPKPFSFIFQSCMEEYTLKNLPQQMNIEKVWEMGEEQILDKSRVRGFGRKPAPEEIELQVLYGIGGGAKIIMGYTDVSEKWTNILFHGTREYPDLETALYRMSRKFALISPLLEIAYPVTWCGSPDPGVRTMTLLAGDKAALVVAVNEDYISDKDGFRMLPKKSVFSFPSLPWLKPGKLHRVDDGRLVPLEMSFDKDANCLRWNCDMKTGEIFILSESNEPIENLVAIHNQDYAAGLDKKFTGENTRKIER